MQFSRVFKHTLVQDFKREKTTLLYYAFGSAITELQYSNDTSVTYRYAYQGSEKDNEIHLCIETTFFRELDSRICRWWSVDPKNQPYAFESPYAMMGNNPIWNKDIAGDSLPLVGNTSGTTENPLTDLRKMVAPENQWRLSAETVNRPGYNAALNVNVGVSTDGTQPAYVAGSDAMMDLLIQISTNLNIHLAYGITANPTVCSKDPTIGNSFVPLGFLDNNTGNAGLVFAIRGLVAINGDPLSNTNTNGYAPPSNINAYLARHPKMQAYTTVGQTEKKMENSLVMAQYISALWTSINSAGATQLTLSQAISNAWSFVNQPNYFGIGAEPSPQVSTPKFMKSIIL